MNCECIWNRIRFELHYEDKYFIGLSVLCNILANLAPEPAVEKKKNQSESSDNCLRFNRWNVNRDR